MPAMRANIVTGQPRVVPRPHLDFLPPWEQDDMQAAAPAMRKRGTVLAVLATIVLSR